MKDKTDLTIILDGSGSMYKHRADALGGLETFLQEQRQDKGECSVSLVSFNNKSKVIWEERNLHTMRHFTPRKYTTKNSTALYDTMQTVINRTGNRLRNLPEAERPDKVLIVALTDGEENASKFTTAKELEDLITHQTEKYNWNFIYLGANQDAIFEASKIGIQLKSSLTYDTKHMKTAFSVASNSVRAYRKSGKVSGFTPNERSKVKEAS